MARIAVGGFQHETNSFVAHRADFAYFADHRDRPPLVRGEAVLSWLAEGSFALSGFMTEMHDHALVPLAWASGGAGGIVTADAFERIVGEIVGRLSAAMPVDAVYLDLHGAMVSEDFESSEGELLRRIRAVVGESVPIVVSLDYHANVSPEMVALSDGIVAFRTYPHVDRPQTGQRAGQVMRALLGRGRPVGRAFRKIPFLIPATAQCTLVEPSRSIVGRSLAVDGDIVSLSYLAGFPPSDLFWCGPAVLAHAWTQAAADRAADALLDEIVAKEADFLTPLAGPDDAVRSAVAISATASKPVIIADVQDNPGAGGTADTTGLLEALVAADARNAVIGFFHDFEAAGAAHAAGEGATVTLDLGGRHGPDGVTPFHGSFRVVRLGTGRFRTDGCVTGGHEVDLGRMALLVIGGVGVVVSSKRMQAFDQAPFRHLGIDPAKQKILVLKSTCHFRAEFEPLAETVILAAAPGGYNDDPECYPFQRLRPGIRLKPLGPAFKCLEAQPGT